MSTVNLKIITPRKIIFDSEVNSVTAPSAEGEITVLPRHENYFTVLIEGIVKIKKEGNEDFLAIGGGYLETDGKIINILVSRAYGQDEVDDKITEEAIKNARKILLESKDEKERQEIASILRRSIIDLKLLKKKRRIK